MSGFTIGEIARRAGVGIDTVRYYERSDLLPPSPGEPLVALAAATLAGPRLIANIEI